MADADNLDFGLKARTLESLTYMKNNALYKAKFSAWQKASYLDRILFVQKKNSQFSDFTNSIAEFLASLNKASQNTGSLKNRVPVYQQHSKQEGRPITIRRALLKLLKTHGTVNRLGDHHKNDMEKKTQKKPRFEAVQGNFSAVLVQKMNGPEAVSFSTPERIRASFYKPLAVGGGAGAPSNNLEKLDSYFISQNKSAQIQRLARLRKHGGVGLPDHAALKVRSLGDFVAQRPVGRLLDHAALKVRSLGDFVAQRSVGGLPVNVKRPSAALSKNRENRSPDVREATFIDNGVSKNLGADFAESVASSLLALLTPELQGVNRSIGPMPVVIMNPQDMQDNSDRYLTNQAGVQTGPTGFDYALTLAHPSGVY